MENVEMLKMQKELYEAKEKIAQLEDILALMPGSVYWQDRDGKYLFCNINAARIVGLKSHKEVIGKRLPEFVDKKYADEIVKSDNELMATDREKTFEEDAFDEEGKPAVYLTKKVPLHHAVSGKVSGLLGISIDITERKKAEVMQREAKELAEKTVKFMETTSGAIAHELSTPLAIINMQMDLLNRAMANESADSNKNKIFFKETIELVKNTVKSATYIISNILVKMRSLVIGKVDKFDFRKTNIVADIENVLALYPFGNKERDLIEFTGDNDFEYFGNKTLTEHVLFNLLKNALRAIRQARHGKISIRLESSDENTAGCRNCNKLIFTDTALGIPEDFLPKIFDQFETKEKNSGGTGLGLAFCKLIMQTYGGSITCKAKEGDYTEFTLSFPKIQAPQT